MIDKFTNSVVVIVIHNCQNLSELVHIIFINLGCLGIIQHKQSPRANSLQLKWT